MIHLNGSDERTIKIPAQKATIALKKLRDATSPIGRELNACLAVGKICNSMVLHVAHVAELADALDSGSSE
jgi:hypothetical protein